MMLFIIPPDIVAFPSLLCNKENAALVNPYLQPQPTWMQLQKFVCGPNTVSTEQCLLVGLLVRSPSLTHSCLELLFLVSIHSRTGCLSPARAAPSKKDLGWSRSYFIRTKFPLLMPSGIVGDPEAASAELMGVSFKCGVEALLMDF